MLIHPRKDMCFIRLPSTLCSEDDFVHDPLLSLNSYKCTEKNLYSQ